MVNIIGNSNTKGPKKALDRAQRYVTTHLATCCREVLESQDSGILCDGRVRQAANIYAEVNARGALKMALDEVARQAMQLTAKR